MKLFHANGAPVLGTTMLSAGGDGGGAAGGNGDGNRDGAGGDGDGGDDEGGDDLAAIREALKKERDRARALERELKPLKTRAQQRDDAEKTEAQKAADRADAAEKRAQALEGSLRQTRVERAIREADRALGLGLHDSDLVADLIGRDLDPDDDFDAEGKPIAKKVEAAVKRLIALRPYLAGAAQRRPGGGDAGAGNSGGAAGGNDMNAMLRRAAGRA